MDPLPMATALTFVCVELQQQKLTPTRVQLEWDPPEDFQNLKNRMKFCLERTFVTSPPLSL